jgi:hypothetical protein
LVELRAAVASKAPESVPCDAAAMNPGKHGFKTRYVSLHNHRMVFPIFIVSEPQDMEISVNRRKLGDSDKLNTQVLCAVLTVPTEWTLSVLCRVRGKGLIIAERHDKRL